MDTTNQQAQGSSVAPEKTEENLKLNRRAVKRTGPRWDYSLIFTVIFLVCFGLLMVYSASYYTASRSQSSNFQATYYLVKQGIFALLGLVAMFVVAKIPYTFIVKKFGIAIYVLSIISSLLVILTPLGVEYNGRKRWLNLGIGTVQPADIIKLALIILLAYLISKMRTEIDKGKKILIAGVIVILPTFLVVTNNLSSAIIIFLIALFMIMMASEKKKIFIFLFIGIVAGYFIFLFWGDKIGDVIVKTGLLKEYQLDRIYAWIDPEADASDLGYQIVQGLYAIGSGGLFGKGLGNSTQKLGFVPEAQNDMIFSIVCEELGLFGAICLIALFVFLLYRIFKIAKEARGPIGYFMVVGIFIHIALQIIFNIAVVTNSMPNTGVSLPFISYGGTALFMIMVEMGFVLSVALHPGIELEEMKRERMEKEAELARRKNKRERMIAERQR